MRIRYSTFVYLLDGGSSKSRKSSNRWRVYTPADVRSLLESLQRRWHTGEVDAVVRAVSHITLHMGWGDNMTRDALYRVLVALGVLEHAREVLKDPTHRVRDQGQGCWDYRPADAGAALDSTGPVFQGSHGSDGGE